jgi:hypothetical protein
MKITLDIAALDRERVLRAADAYLKEKPVTVTAVHSPRSAGGPHDFSSEGDSWWPDPKNPDGPYIQRDGMTNPENFVAHRQAMVRMSRHVAALTAAWRITGKAVYARHAVRHLRAWFADEKTRMNPDLRFAQAIKGVPQDAGSASSILSISSNRRAAYSLWGPPHAPMPMNSPRCGAGSPTTSAG